jgi:outer membrane protein assembly factor BamD (BamD/ComL family)
MRCVWPVLVVLGCSSPPPPPEEAETALAGAERLVQEQDFVGGLAVLDGLDVDDLPKPLRPRYLLALARCQAGTGEPWEAFLTIRDFADDHPHSDLRDQVVELQYQVGSRLIASDAGFWIFWSDRHGGRTCLQHLITRYPDTEHLADALRLLGEMAYDEGDLADARNRYRELMRRRPESEWVPLARFRYAMSIVEALRGPEYDLDQMQHATKELADFLASPPENQEFVRAAEEARARLLRWQAERHLLVADFYAEIGNRPGEVLHLRKAAAPELTATDASEQARRRLTSLGEPLEAGQ